MGVKHFYLWYRRNCTDGIYHLKPNRIDNLAIDMNGLFHLCTQKVYQYGNYECKTVSLLRKREQVRDPILVYRAVCEKINECVQQVNPQKRLILCVDGIAGLAKMNQQRQRRFRSGMNRAEMVFDPNSITPGTEFMDRLTRYIDYYIHTMMNYDDRWKNIEVIFSNEKDPGEGEHKIMNYVRRHVPKHENLVINGLDADLMMLGMLLPIDEVYMMREPEWDVYQYVNLRAFQRFLTEKMRWKSERTFYQKSVIDDFIMLCFLVGNDFLPTVPTLTILDGAIEDIIATYREIGGTHGHLTRQTRGRVVMRNEALDPFMRAMSFHEKRQLEDKYNDPEIRFFRDPMVEKYRSESGAIDFEGYKREYYAKKFPGVSIREICHRYLEGMTWVLNYYKTGIPDWLWYFPYMYGPFLSDLAEEVGDWRCREFELNRPVDPFLQLLAVLPPSSGDLLPNELNHLMYSPQSPILEYFPREFVIDVYGKRKDWEGIVILPTIDIERFRECYERHIPEVKDARLQKRNKRGRCFSYRVSTEESEYRGPYGRIDSNRVRRQYVR
jgi:5'-3' exoribonuclease 1